MYRTKTGEKRAVNLILQVRVYFSLPRGENIRVFEEKVKWFLPEAAYGASCSMRCTLREQDSPVLHLVALTAEESGTAHAKMY